VCDLRATAIAAGSCYGARITGPTASTYDDGARGVRGQTVLAEDFRMVRAARQRGALRIPNAAFLISIDALLGCSRFTCEACSGTGARL